jgi:hypothetical protein
LSQAATSGLELANAFGVEEKSQHLSVFDIVFGWFTQGCRKLQPLGWN